MKEKKIKKAVIPAAGFGTRLLPATKAQPKEMIVIVDKPALQYLVEELVDSGIEEILIVTGRNKSSIENHFDFSFELERTLEEKQKYSLLKTVNSISNMSDIYYVRQKKPLGLGHAISCAKSFIGNEPFLVLLGDDIIYTDPKKNEIPVSKQLIDKYYNLQEGSILGIQKVPENDVNKYGIIKPLKNIDTDTMEVDDFVEKPNKEEAPSQFGVLGRYILEPEIFGYLENLSPGKDGEIQLTDAILNMKKDGKKLYAYNFKGKRHPELGKKFREYLKSITKTMLSE